MGVRDRLGRVGCAMGLHGGEWAWIADGSCAQAHNCPRCGRVKSRTEHNLTDWSYTAPDDTTSCLMERHCARCLRTDQSVRHEPRWHYDSAGRCAGQMSCERCGTPSDGRGIRHQWGPWMPDREAVTMQNPLTLRTSRLARTCARCAGREQMS